MNKTPQFHHPDLSDDRLQYLADLMVKVRHDTLELYDEVGGDDPWSHGCRAYARTKSNIVKESENLEWLKVLDASLQFVFAIGEVPIRFYRGAPEKPNEKTMRRSFSELNQLSLNFTNEVAASLAWRFAIETDIDGEVSQVSFFGSSLDKSIVCRWDANIHEFVTDISSELVQPIEGVNLDAPMVTIPIKRKYSGE